MVAKRGQAYDLLFDGTRPYGLEHLRDQGPSAIGMRGLVAVIG
jgi:hypothetical protein